MAQRLYRRASYWDEEIVQTTISLLKDSLCKSKCSTKTARLSSNLSRTTMIIAVYKVGEKLYTSTNLKKKFKKKLMPNVLFQMEYTGNSEDAEKILYKWIECNLLDKMKNDNE